MACTLDVDRRLKGDILHASSAVRDEIGKDLLALQENPVPADRKDLGRPNGYFHRLPCGVYVSWELIGDERDIVSLILTGICRGITVRVLGAGTESPE